jgi:hypothetical protein
MWVWIGFLYFFLLLSASDFFFFFYIPTNNGALSALSLFLSPFLGGGNLLGILGLVFS